MTSEDDSYYIEKDYLDELDEESEDFILANTKFKKLSNYTMSDEELIKQIKEMK